jgi:Tol biopolymer transport system component
MLVFRRCSTESQCEIYAQALADGRPVAEPVQMTCRGVRSTGPVWAADQRKIFFSSGDFKFGGQRYLQRAREPSNSGPTTRLTASSGDAYFSPAVSWRGGLLAYTRKQRDLNIWAIEKTEHGWQAPRAVPLISSTRSDLDPSLSADGAQVAFVSDRSGHPELWVARRDGSEPRKLTSLDGANLSCPRWSPDARQITFSAYRQASYSIWTIDASGGAPRKLVEPGWSSSWSHDGRWIYYSLPVINARQVFKMPSQGGPSSKVVEIAGEFHHPEGKTAATPGAAKEYGWEAGNMPVESPDGRYLFLKTIEGVWRVPAAGGQSQLAVGIPWYTQYAVAADGIFFHGPPNPGTDNRSLLYYSFADRRTTEVLRTGHRPALGLAVSVSGNTLLVSQIDHDVTDLMFAQGLR